MRAGKRSSKGEEMLSLRDCAVRFGFLDEGATAGAERSAKDRFRRYVESRERELGKQLFVKQGIRGDMRITKSRLKRYFPELFEKSRDQLAVELSRFSAKHLERVDDTIEEKLDNRLHGVEVLRECLLELQGKCEVAAGKIAKLERQIERLNDSAHIRPDID